MVDAVLREQAVQTVIDVRFLRCLLFKGKGLGRSGRRIDIWHLEHCRNAAHCSCGCAGLPVLLVRITRLAEVHMDVDGSREEMETGCVKRFPCGRHRTLLADG